MNQKFDSHQMQASTLLVITPIIILIMYILLGNEQFRSLVGFSDRGSTGDFLAGISAPVIAYLSALLIYRSFQQQLTANQIQYGALIESKTKQFKEDKIREIERLIQNFREDIEKFFFKSETDSSRMYSGQAALYKFTLDLANNKTNTLNNADYIIDSVVSLSSLSEIIMNKILTSDLEQNEKENLAKIFEVYYSMRFSKHARFIAENLYNDNASKPIIKSKNESVTNLISMILGNKTLNQ